VFVCVYASVYKNVCVYVCVCVCVHVRVKSIYKVIVQCRQCVKRVYCLGVSFTLDSVSVVLCKVSTVLHRMIIVLNSVSKVLYIVSRVLHTSCGVGVDDPHFQILRVVGVTVIFLEHLHMGSERESAN
jgi:hypothetical protein